VNRSFSRRRFLGGATAAAALGALQLRPERASAAPWRAPIGDRGHEVEEALSRLREGNQRFAAANLLNPGQSAERRVEVSRAQNPFAVVLGCSDSRVPPEIVFDQGLGDLFTIRVAGNVIDGAGLGSIEFAVEEFDVPLVVVLGHERCGAVVATIDALTSGAQVPPHVDSLVNPIRPAAERARFLPGDWVDNTVRANIELVTGQLQTSEPVLAHLVSAGELTVIGARYGLATGQAEFLNWAVQSH
jgi:carbonic anhydrase